jgi:glucosamine 6-phosphate synthetase-like amidotransferase/phosphosugar isomerase protein
MCGINGMVFLKGVKRNANMMSKIRFIFDQLLYETQDRGEHATGIASFKRDGSYELHKKDINADKMTTKDEAYRKIVEGFNAKETSVIISHTRYYTKGKPDNNLNNHPFDIGNVVGLHNGSIKNDDFLFSKYAKEFTRIGEVDSEIIFQLINHYNQEGITYAGLKKALEDTFLKGVFALAFVHKNNPNMLNLVKQEKPMYVAYGQEAGIVIFNSDDDYIKNAFHTLERVGHAFGLKNVKQNVSCKKVNEDTYLTVNADATTLEDAISEPVKLYIESSTYTYTNTSNRGTSTSNYGSRTKSKYETVTATDSKGLVLQGEIDTATGEVIIWTKDNETVITEETEIYECYECGDPMTDEDLQATFNSSNPVEESICLNCYAKIMEEYMTESDNENTKVDCDGHKVG